MGANDSDNGLTGRDVAGRVRSPGGATIPCGEGHPEALGAASVDGGYIHARVQLVLLPGGARTWTVVGADHVVVAPVEGFLEYMRVLGRSPNTVKSYARGLALWCQFLAAYGLAWDGVRLEDFGRFLGWLRTGDTPAVASIEPRPARFSEETVAVRLQAVASFYRFHHFNGVEAASGLYERAFGRGRPYKPMLEHLARRRGTTRSLVRVSRRRRASPPTLTPGQIDAILEACARWDEPAREWRGSVRDRLLWALLAETGLRLAEALGLQHRDWHTGLGDTPWIEVVPREHPHGLRVKGQAYRKLFVSDELDRLYGDYLFELCNRGVELHVEDLDGHWVFVNLEREPRFAPLRAETVRGQVLRLRRQLRGRVPERFTPHWLRHTHATALLLSGVAEHVVSRRLGHTDIQTTQNLYGWVSEDAEQRTVAEWKALTERWRTET
jgi:integrase